MQGIDLVKFATHAGRCKERVLLAEGTKLRGVEPMMDDPTWLTLLLVWQRDQRGACDSWIRCLRGVNYTITTSCVLQRPISLDDFTNTPRHG